MNCIQSLQKPDDSISLKIAEDKDRKQIEIILKDEGIGISKENLLKVRQPFFTTKGLTGSIGLGLTISSDIVEKHKGEMEIVSELGNGTTVIIKLPINKIPPVKK